MYRGRMPGEYTNVSIPTEITIPLLATVGAGVAIDVALVALFLLVAAIYISTAGWALFWGWTCRNWAVLVVALVAPWVIVPLVFVGRMISEVWHKNWPPMYTPLNSTRPVGPFGWGKRASDAYFKMFGDEETKDEK